MPARNIVVFAVLMSSYATHLQAQAQSDTVPKELMAVLMRGPGTYPNDSFDLRVGPPPKDFPTEVLPPTTQIGVSAITERSITVAGTVSAPVDRLKEEQRLLAAGWTHGMSRPRGFASSSADVPVSVCRGTDFVLVSYPSRPDGGSFVRANLTRDPRRPCLPRPEYGFADVIIPMLTPPEGIRAYASGASSGMDSTSATARLERKLSPQAAAKHYAAQMQAAGWTLDGVTLAGADFAVARLSTKTKAGDAITGMIAITALTGTQELDALMYVVRNKSDRRFPGVPGGVVGGVIVR